MTGSICASCLRIWVNSPKGSKCHSCGWTTREIVKEDYIRYKADDPGLGSKNPNFWRRVQVTQYVVDAPTRQGAHLKGEQLLADERLRFLKEGGDQEDVTRELSDEEKKDVGGSSQLTKAAGLETWIKRKRGDVKQFEIEVHVSRGGRWRIEVFTWVPK